MAVFMHTYVHVAMIIVGVCKVACNENVPEKRILLNDPNLLYSQIQTLESKVEGLSTQLNDVQTRLQSEQNALSDLTRKYNTLLSTSKYEGGIFVRWGSRTCPPNITELVYTGSAGGSWYDDPGAAAEYVCLPQDPDLTPNFSSDHARMYGTEYDSNEFGHHDGDDVPCSVCRSKYETSVIMIPGKNQCYSTWRKQYSGYLVAGYKSSKSATQYICLDENPEALPAGHVNNNGKLIVPVKAVCGSLPCPPYQDNTYLTCVVCTK